MLPDIIKFIATLTAAIGALTLVGLILRHIGVIT